MSLPTDPQCKPVLVITGIYGSGKTRTARGIFELYGLNPRIIKVVDNESSEHNFWVSLNAGGIACFDNVDSKIKWLPDALAAASTGGSFEKKQNYTDATNFKLNAKAWPIITSTNPQFASDVGLADRLLVDRMNKRSEDTEESRFSYEIYANRDAGLSFICQAISIALADRRGTPKNLNKRHPDFASFAVKLGRAIDREAEAIHALWGAELDKSMLNLENDELGAGILHLIEKAGRFSGTAAQLLKNIVEVDAESNLGDWSAKRAGKRLSTLWPHISELFECSKIDGRNNAGFTISKKLAPFAPFQESFSLKPLTKENKKDFSENSVLNGANTAMHEGCYHQKVKCSASIGIHGICNLKDESQEDWRNIDRICEDFDPIPTPRSTPWKTNLP